MGGLFSGPDGKVSMMRVSTFLIVAPIILTFVAHNVISMIAGGTFVSIGAPEAMLIAGVLGMKSVQSFSENKKAIVTLPDNEMPTQ